MNALEGVGRWTVEFAVRVAVFLEAVLEVDVAYWVGAARFLLIAAVALPFIVAGAAICFEVANDVLVDRLPRWRERAAQSYAREWLRNRLLNGYEKLHMADPLKRAVDREQEALEDGRGVLVFQEMRDWLLAGAGDRKSVTLRDLAMARVLKQIADDPQSALVANETRRVLAAPYGQWYLCSANISPSPNNLRFYHDKTCSEP